MTIDEASYEEHRFTHQQNRIIRALVQQSTKLNARIMFLEQAIDPSGPAPTEEDRRSVFQARMSSTALAEEIASIGSSVNTVIAAIDASRGRRASSERKPDVMTLPERPAWRSPANRPAGWQPVAVQRV